MLTEDKNRYEFEEVPRIQNIRRLFQRVEGKEEDLKAVMGRQKRYLYFSYQAAIAESYPATEIFAKSFAVSLRDRLG